MCCLPSKHSFRSNWFNIALRGPPKHSQVWELPKRTLRQPQSGWGLTTRDQMCARLSNRKENRACPMGRPSHRVPGLLSQNSQTHTTPQARASPCENWLKCYHSGNLLETQHPRFYGGGGSHKQPPLGTGANLRLPGGKQVCSINHIVCIVEARPASYHQGREGTPAKSKFPGTSRGNLACTLSVEVITRILVVSMKGSSLSCYLGRVDRRSTTELCFQPLFDVFLSFLWSFFFNLHCN